MEREFYSTRRWREVRAQARARDGDRCSVSRLLGGTCGGRLHVHHLDPDGDPVDLDNLLTVCQSCHPRLEALQRGIMEKRRREWRRCPHRHRYAHARLECERRLNLALAE